MKTLDSGTRLLDNTAFVRIQVVERFCKNFSDVCGLRIRGFQLILSTIGVFSNVGDIMMHVGRYHQHRGGGGGVQYRLEKSFVI